VLTDVAVPQLSDAALIEASHRDTEMFGLLYDRYAAQLFRYANRRIGAEHAEDAVADAFLIAFRGRARYDVGRPDARPWLFGILTKVIARRRRAEQARYRMLARAGSDDVGAGFADDVTASVAARSSRGPLAGALRRLSSGDRDVLLLIAWGDLTYEEVALTLDIKIGTVRSRLHRARRKLREALGPTHSADFFEGNS
jgi:RNA polymerase sigma factor (sigma-70 family)